MSFEQEALKGKRPTPPNLQAKKREFFDMSGYGKSTSKSAVGKKKHSFGTPKASTHYDY
jgi:hypothetical protein